MLAEKIDQLHVYHQLLDRINPSQLLDYATTQIFPGHKERILQVQENKGRQAAVAEYLTLVRSYCGWGFEFLDALNFTGLRDLAYMLDPNYVPLIDES